MFMWIICLLHLLAMLNVEMDLSIFSLLEATMHFHIMFICECKPAAAMICPGLRGHVLNASVHKMCFWMSELNVT
jgi:hypothetical protein